MATPDQLHAVARLIQVCPPSKDLDDEALVARAAQVRGARGSRWTHAYAPPVVLTQTAKAKHAPPQLQTLPNHQAKPGVISAGVPLPVGPADTASGAAAGGGAHQKWDYVTEVTVDGVQAFVGTVDDESMASFWTTAQNGATSQQLPNANAPAKILATGFLRSGYLQVKGWASA